ncbi:hypothetical protein [Taibaiella koreensis]|uniref:hypothetical protein n=1 Tax=Taibaiella koreensis TaxID=1268548 RepID=UPI000E59A77C|nr:hypothetical protein [Taibaiella koreensis]
MMPRRSILALILFFLLCTGSSHKGNAQFVPPVKPADSSAVKPVLPPRPSALKYSYYQELGAACKVEWKLERATKLPLRLRLGSLQQTDYLEQKPNAQKP